LTRRWRTIDSGTPCRGNRDFAGDPQQRGTAMKNGKHVILCIDDDRDFLDSLQIIIEDNDYVFESAGSAEDGLRQFKAVKPDLVIVDLMMEEVDAGVNFVKEVKALGAKVPPIYMFSSVGDNLNAMADYSQLGLSGVLQKPVNPAVLLATLKAKLK
jgi:two-component system chemotaxis response regulator CheY